MSFKSLVREVAERIKYDNELDRQLKECTSKVPRYSQRELVVVQLARKYDSYVYNTTIANAARDSYIEGHDDGKKGMSATYF